MLSSNTWAQCFQPTTNYPVGAGPSSVALSDLNADGQADIVVANRTSRTISILPGLGTGSFGAATNYPTGNAPYSIALADVNGDGQLDVIALSTNQTLSVLLGQVGGGFAAPVLYPAGRNGVFVAVADVNGDTYLDIITANGVTNSSSVSILLGLGDGTFGPQTFYPVGGAPTSVAVGDVNQDGNPDLITSNLSNNVIAVVLGNGNGSFGPPTFYSSGIGPYSVALKDVNGDGYLDVISANVNANSVSILLGLGTGGFGAATNYPVGSSPYSVALNDVDGDGRADIVTANFNSNTISVLLGQADGLFGLTSYYPVGAGPFSVALGAVNADGRADIVVANLSGNTVSVLLSGTPVGITQQPTSSSNVTAGASVSVPVSVSGSVSSYQWYKNSLASPLVGQTSATLNLPNVQLADVGSYSVVVMGACTSVTSAAFNLVVTQPIRYVKADGSGDGSSWATASGDLQAMINAAGVQQVWVAQGTYKPTTTTNRQISFIMKNGVSILGGFADSGDPNLAQRSPASFTTILSGDIGTPGINTDNSYHVVFNNSGQTTTAVLDGFVITAGYDNTNSTAGGAASGGAMYNGNCSPRLINCLFVNNFIASRVGQGGGMYNSNSSPTLINCTFANNSSGRYGGAMFNVNSNPVLINCSFQGNSATSQGGVIYNVSGNPSLTNCVVFGNGGANTFVGGAVTANYSLFESSVTGYTSGSGNLTTTTSPFASTATTQLAAGSPAINAGNSLSYTAAGGPPTDLAGNIRIQNGTIDMGAHEFSLPTDLIPLLYVTPSLAYSTTPGSVVVDVFEINSAPTSGTITVHISKSSLLTLSFDPGATSLAGKPVQNSGWSFDGTSNSNAYILTTTQAVGAGSKLSFGLSSLLTPGQTKGTISVTATLVGASGGEVRVTNNTDADQLEYFSK